MSVQTLLVIGAGPGGYAAALSGAARGLSVTLVDDQPIGGACLNRGCIPSKYLLTRAKQTADALRLRQAGVDLRLESVRIDELLREKDAVLETLRQRMEQAAKSSRIQRLQGRARFTSPHDMDVLSTGGTIQRVTADAIVLATGTSPVMPSSFPNHPAILNSTTIFELNYLPSHLVVLGAGYIGCELACAFQGLGSKVTLIEKEPRLLPTQPEFEAASAILTRSFERRGITVWTQTRVDRVTPLDAQRLGIACSNGESLEANALLLALGRAPVTDGLDLAKAGVAVAAGRPNVNASFQTSVPHIYAIGDLVSPLPLAHTAAREAEVVIDHLFGHAAEMDYPNIPRCIYTWPEAAAVGLTEAQARDAGFTVRVDRYHFAASAKAMVEGEAEGFWLVISDTPNGRIVGAQVVGPHSTELIHLLALAIRARQTLKDVAAAVFAHPTLSEGLQELAARAQRSVQLKDQRR
ncbi:MAG TPA: NAD(P)/FAD-dependent oxidoreductase [Elusimicrobiota bacterium]|nr:NAD(P)/FAD-dependent oxidoreductase [Elusimicrobiota bacterium]